MMPMRRQPAPAAWKEKERSYLTKLDKLAGKAPLHGWQHEGQKLAHWFHAVVRPGGEPALCAYCDGPLGETSPQTIDHFLPEEVFPELGLDWHNLYPACASCNTEHKGRKWSCYLLRPDSDLISSDVDLTSIQEFQRWFDFNPLTGAISSAPGASRTMRIRARLTIHIFGLNKGTRCNARIARWRELLNVVKHPADYPRLDELVRLGPYRFVAGCFLAYHEAQKNR